MLLKLICYIFPGDSEKHPLAYFSEIAYRFNRRFKGKELFDRLIQACVNAEAIIKNDLAHKKTIIRNYVDKHYK